MVGHILHHLDDSGSFDTLSAHAGYRRLGGSRDVGDLGSCIVSTDGIVPIGIGRHASKQAHASSFLFGYVKDLLVGGGSSSTGKEGKIPQDPDEKRIEEVNATATKDFNAINKFATAAPQARKALEDALKARLEVMKPLCHEYMYHRSELMGLAGTQCQAAQGRINAADLDDTTGPQGCLADTQVGQEPVGTPLVLADTRCTHGNRKLLCYERLEELGRGEPAPGEDPTQLVQKRKVAKDHPAQGEHQRPPAENAEGATPPPTGDGAGTDAATAGNPEPPDEAGEERPASMDEEFRLWCHPAFRLDVLPISEDLSRGVLAPKEGDDEPVSAA